MGAGQSGGVEIGGSSMGYQVLRVYPNSPGSRAGLKAYFDFIIAIGNTRFNKENGSLREILKASVDQKLKMAVYNTRTKSAREVEIVPTTSWGGNGLLGVSIKHSSFDRADERVWHVVEVEPGSPAQQAGLRSNEDYVIGSDSILQENDDLYNLVEAHEGKALKLFVYNINTDNCREVICHPNSRWGGKGYLGCEFGHGLLHRIPYGDVGGDTDNPRASLIRNEQPIATQQAQQNNNTYTFQNQLMQQQVHQLQNPTQPGQQLFQQALLDQKPMQQQQQQRQHSQPAEKVLPPPPQLPQTFAQLANAQYQAPQYPQLSQQQPTQYQMPSHQAAQYEAPQYPQLSQQEPTQYQMPPHQAAQYQAPQYHQLSQQEPTQYQMPSYQAAQNQAPPISPNYPSPPQVPQHQPPTEAPQDQPSPQVPQHQPPPQPPQHQLPLQPPQHQPPPQPPQHQLPLQPPQHQPPPQTPQ